MKLPDFPELERSASGTRVPYADQIVAQVRAMIKDGRLPAGGYAPAEHRLAHHLGVSRATVRRAYESMPELVPQQGSGWQVSK